MVYSGGYGVFVPVIKGCCGAIAPSIGNIVGVGVWGLVRPKNDANKTRILGEALAIFSAKGFDGSSMREIAKASGTPVSVLYHYFDSKEDLFGTIIYPAVEDLFARLLSRVDFSMHVPVEDVFTSILELRNPENLGEGDLYAYRTGILEWMGERGQTPLRDRLRELIDSLGDSIVAYLVKRRGDSDGLGDMANLLFSYMQYETICNLFGIRAFAKDRVKREIAAILSVGGDGCAE